MTARVRVKSIPGKMVDMQDVMNALLELMPCNPVSGEDGFIVRVAGLECK